MLAKLTGAVGALALILGCAIGCGGGEEGPVGECPPNSEVQQDSGSSILFVTCIGCHSQNLEGAAREGAPVGSDFDTVAPINAQAEEIYARSIDGSMPPGGGLNELQIENLRVYLACSLAQDQ